MRECVITIRPADRDDQDLILAWWGIPEVRKFTTTERQPTFAELLAQLRYPGRRDFMIIYQARRIGRTCLLDHQTYEELSLYIGELSLHGRGIGTEAIRLTANLVKKPVRAKVMRENSASLRAFFANGFSVLSEDEAVIWLTQDAGRNT